MQKIVLGIHGLGNKPPYKLLELWWKKSTRDGLKYIGKDHPFLHFELVYWAHILHPHFQNPSEKDPKHSLYINDPYQPPMDFSEKKFSPLRKKVLTYIKDQLGGLMLKDNKSLDFSALTDMIMHHFFSDLAIYFSRDSNNSSYSGWIARDMIRRELAYTLAKYRKYEILLIAHSMGSIIAYDVLTQLTPHITIDTFVTIGSPLGIPAINAKIRVELQQNGQLKDKTRTPENIKNHWFNFSDLDDKIAIDFNLQEDFAANSAGILPEDYIVSNHYEYKGAKNPHKSYGYLCTPQMARVIDSFMETGRSKLYLKLSRMINRFFSEKI